MKRSTRNGLLLFMLSGAMLSLKVEAQQLPAKAPVGCRKEIASFQKPELMKVVYPGADYVNGVPANNSIQEVAA